MNDWAVKIEGLSKKFGMSLKSSLKYGLLDSARRLVRIGKNSETLRHDEFWALKDVDFTLKRGEAMGVMGVNGSGKTTLLRILNGTYSPDVGRAKLRGRVGALIAAGAGFSPMLTGRENVFVNGTILGMTSGEIRKRFDEIVDFADLGEFIDMPVRNYSNGMNVRLGFSIAVLGNPDILLVDEVLAVGDLNFQKKCFERILEIKQQGVAIILVSHSIGSIWSICDSALLLDHGITDGKVSVEAACRGYEMINYAARMKQVTNTQEKTLNQPIGDFLSSEFGLQRCGTQDVIVNDVELLSLDGKRLEQVAWKTGFILRYHIDVINDIDGAIVRTGIDSELYKCVAMLDSYEQDRKVFNLKKGKCIIDVIVDKQNFRPGVYSITSCITKRTACIHLFLDINCKSFVVSHPYDVFIYADFRSAMHIDSRYIKHDSM